MATACGVLVAIGLLALTGLAASRTDTALPETPRPAAQVLPVAVAEPEAAGPAPARSRSTEQPRGGRSEKRVRRAATSDVATDWVGRTSARTGIGRVALTAYASASLRMATEQPACRIGWTTLAGIGAVESGHGTNGGAHLQPDGTTSQPILGPALDGTGGTAAIRSTAESVDWHGDRRWDHAVGPMQFIPSTWRRWGTDGSGDGRADPNNVLDAAVAAARYLCASGGDLTTAQGWTRAVFSYNHSDAYVRSVLARANRYAR